MTHYTRTVNVLVSALLYSSATLKAGPVHLLSVPPKGEKPVEGKFTAYVENDSWKDLEYKNNLTRKTVDTGIDDPIAFTWDSHYLAFVENDSWQDLEYIDMETGKKTDTNVDKPLKIAVVDHYLLYVENDSWRDLEIIDMRTGKRKDTGIDNPATIEFKDGTFVTDKGTYKP